MASAALSCSAQVSYTMLVDTPDELSFTFTGSGNSLIGLGTGGFSSVGYQASIEQISYPSSGFAWAIAVNHKPDGPVADLGYSAPSSPLPGFKVGLTPYGQTMTDSMSLAHDGGVDIYSLSLTVAAPATGATGWGEFSGFFKAAHTQGTSVPDAGTTLTLMSLALGLLPFARRFRA